MVLLIGNISLLVLVNAQSAAVNPQDALRTAVQTDQKSFNLLSYWQGLLASKEPVALPEKKSAFDGLSIDPEYQESVVSVMIDNLSAARPQHSGIRQASIVYEALAEGGITRLMLIFPYQELDRVGPVRSARDYFVNFAEEYGGVYLHAGGSPQALQKLDQSSRIYNFDEDDGVGKPSYSFRDLKYNAPHNLFFNLLSVRDRAQQMDWKLKPTVTNWCFTDQDLTSDQRVSQLLIDYAKSANLESIVQFHYDADSKTYLRFYGQKNPTPHIDQLDHQQVAPTNIIVEVAPSSLIDGDVKERINLQNIGSGKAILYRHGKKIEGRWAKDSENTATRYTDLQGNPFCLNPGQTWIAVVDAQELVKETP